MKTMNDAAAYLRKKKIHELGAYSGLVEQVGSEPEILKMLLHISSCGDHEGVKLMVAITVGIMIGIEMEKQ